MSLIEAYEPSPLQLPGSIEQILDENPEASFENAVVAQAELLERYRSAASGVLGISVEDLHDLGPGQVGQSLELANENTGETAQA